MTFIQSIKTCFSKYVTFSGRAVRGGAGSDRVIDMRGAESILRKVAGGVGCALAFVLLHPGNANAEGSAESLLAVLDRNCSTPGLPLEQQIARFDGFAPATGEALAAAAAVHAELFVRMAILQGRLDLDPDVDKAAWDELIRDHVDRLVARADEPPESRTAIRGLKGPEMVVLVESWKSGLHDFVSCNAILGDVEPALAVALHEPFALAPEISGNGIVYSGFNATIPQGSATVRVNRHLARMTDSNILILTFTATTESH